jgi:class 3 adenylate cyclase
VHAPKAAKVAVRHLGERVDERLGDGALFEFPVAQVGYGPVRVIPEALINDVWVAGEPVTLDIPPP